MPDSILQFDTSLEAWRHLVVSHSDLPETIENYLVITLSRMIKHDCTSGVLAFDWLDLMASPAAYQQEKLRNFGDECLILTGFFPGFVKKHRVSVRYCQSFGQSAFLRLSHLYASRSQPQQADLYQSIEGHFTPMVDVMTRIRISQSRSE